MKTIHDTPTLSERLAMQVGDRLVFKSRPHEVHIVTAVSDVCITYELQLTPKEPPMTSKEMLALEKYNSTSECPKCGCVETLDEYIATLAQYPSVPLRTVRRTCCGGDKDTGGCGFTRYELPLDWTEEEAGRLAEWCMAVADKERAEKVLRARSYDTR